MQRSVSRASEWELIPGASYFDTVLKDHRLARAEYFEAARQVLRNSDLVFIDPDNGIEVPSTKLGASGSSKYVYWSELQAMYTDGQSMLVYQHFPRVVRERFVPFIAGRLSEELHGSTVVGFRRRTWCSSLCNNQSTPRRSRAPHRRWGGSGLGRSKFGPL